MLLRTRWSNLLGMEFKLSWREAGPLNQHDDIVDSDQYVVNKELSLSGEAIQPKGPPGQDETVNAVRVRRIGL